MISQAQMQHPLKQVLQCPQLQNSHLQQWHQRHLMLLLTMQWLQVLLSQRQQQNQVVP
jgi:hypothetical protein